MVGLVQVTKILELKEVTLPMREIQFQNYILFYPGKISMIGNGNGQRVLFRSATGAALCIHVLVQ